jgi:hypothetical protein
MQQTQKLLFDEISSLPIEKIGKALSFVRYLNREPETELWLDPEEETELHTLLTSGDTVDASELIAKIKELPND